MTQQVFYPSDPSLRYRLRRATNAINSNFAALYAGGTLPTRQIVPVPDPRTRGLIDQINAMFAAMWEGDPPPASTLRVRDTRTRLWLRRAIAAIQANVAELNAEPAGPAWLSEGAVWYADFENANYYRDGSADKALADMLTTNAEWGAYNPASLQAGVGLVDSDGVPLVMPVILSPGDLFDGFTAVAEFDIANNGDARLVLAVADTVGWVQEFSATYGRSSNPRLYTADTGITAAGGSILSVGPHRAAFTYQPGGVATSYDGGSVTNVTDAIAREVDTIGLTLAYATLRRLWFLPIQANANLPALSALA